MGESKRKQSVAGMTSPVRTVGDKAVKKPFELNWLTASFAICS